MSARRFVLPARGRLHRGLAILAMALVSAVAWSATASAKVSLQTFSVELTGPQAQVAGGHPDLTTTFMVTNDPTAGPYGNPWPAEDVRDVTVDLPAGFVGSAVAAPQCTYPDLTHLRCSADSQVGIVGIIFDAAGHSSPVGIYNMVPSAGHTAEFGFNVQGQASNVGVVSVRSDGDYGLRVTMKGITSQVIPTYGAKVTLWGVPADPVHDAERYAGFPPAPGASSGAPRVAYITNPSVCGTPFQASIVVNSYQDPTHDTHQTADIPAMSGCGDQQSHPKMTVRAEATTSATPSGMLVDLDVPQADNPGAVATPPVKDVSLTFPWGVSISAAAASGLQGCTDDQVGIGSAGAPACPDASKIGSVQIDTPLLPEALKGDVYLGAPKSNDAQSGNMFRILLTAEGSGVRLKLPGSITPDPATGQLTAAFRDEPQLQFSHLALRLDGGPHAVLTLPEACGTATSSATVTDWGGRSTTSTSAFDVTSCPGAGTFGPTLAAGSVNPAAGASSPFTLTFGRPAGQVWLGKLVATLPPGLMAEVAGVPLCADAQAAAGTCSADTRVGRVDVLAGDGSDPLPLAGQVYLTGPYHGAPFGLSIVIPAMAGPYNLGTVVVRAAVSVDPHDAHLRVVSDDIPTMLQGVPFRLRSVSVTIDRGGFMVNPTSCDPMQVLATISSVAGTAVDTANRYQVGSCQALPFAPRIRMTTDGTVEKNADASLHVSIEQSSPSANLRTVRVTLPEHMGPRLSTLNQACAENDYVAGTCGPGSAIGQASVSTPILPVPLTGPVHLVARKGQLPLMMVDLAGQGINIQLKGDVSFAGSRLVATFDGIPDVPISRFDMDLPKGAGSALTSDARLCDQRLEAPTSAVGQSGVTDDQDVRVTATGCKVHIARASRKGAASRLTLSGVEHTALTVRGGRLVRPVKRSVRRSHIAHVTVRLTGKGRRVYAKHHDKLRVRVHVTAELADGSTQKTARWVTFRPAKRGQFQTS
ncbi:MAG TPA: hypothetical protein VFT50_18270 [Baekduia sp.]|nr:hypothetical protein [Baekduia sp.]